jgi:hypothetical protein
MAQAPGGRNYVPTYSIQEGDREEGIAWYTAVYRSALHPPTHIGGGRRQAVHPGHCWWQRSSTRSPTQATSMLQAGIQSPS